MTQESAVASLIQNPEAEKWAEGHTGWNKDSKAQVCQWDFVECDPIDESVTKISIPGEGIKATLPPEWGTLTSLTELDLRKNALYGTFPPSVSTSLPSLELLDVSENDLSGPIPPFSSSSSSSSSSSAAALHTLRMEKNRLSGPAIPPSLTENCRNLVKLDLSHNGLTGAVPKEIRELQFLGFLDLGFNGIGGSVPAELGELKELMGLFLNNNEIAGTVPPSLGRDDSKIVQLFLEHNRLSGTVPASLADLPRLVDLFIDGNKFTGTVPPDLCSLNLNDDFFRGVYASQKYGNETNEGSSERDGCNSIACPVNTVSREGVHPCYPCGPQGFNPYLGRNGRCYHTSEKMILDILYDRTNGPMWSGGAGWGVTDVEKCDYDGIACNSAGHVVNITLSKMNLRGDVPDELGYLRHLRHLDLSDNELTGYLPSDLRFAPLEYLDVSGNRLRGFVPPMLCLTGDVNSNGAGGDYDCDNVACGAGSYSPIGRATARGTVDPKTMLTYQCTPCPLGADYIGSKACGVHGDTVGEVTRAFLSRSVTTNVAAIVIGVLLAAICVPLVALAQFRRWRDAHYDDDSESDYSFDEDEDDFSAYSDGHHHGRRRRRGEREALDAGAPIMGGGNEQEAEEEYGGPAVLLPPALIANGDNPQTNGDVQKGGAEEDGGGSLRSRRSSASSHHSGGSGGSDHLASAMMEAPATVKGRETPENGSHNGHNSHPQGEKEDLWLDVPEIT